MEVTSVEDTCMGVRVGLGWVEMLSGTTSFAVLPFITLAWLKIMLFVFAFSSCSFQEGKPLSDYKVAA
jgi:hypothetical protein